MHTAAHARIVTSTQSSPDGVEHRRCCVKHTRTQTPLRCAAGKLPTHTNTHPRTHTHTHTQSAKAQIKGMRQDLLICGSRIKNNTMTTLLCFSGSALTDFWLMTLKIAAGEREKKNRAAPTVDEG